MGIYLKLLSQHKHYLQQQQRPKHLFMDLMLIFNFHLNFKILYNGIKQLFINEEQDYLI